MQTHPPCRQQQQSTLIQIGLLYLCVYGFLPYFSGFYIFLEELAGLLHNDFVSGIQLAKLLDVPLNCGVKGILGLITFPFKLICALIQLLHYFL